MRLGVLYLVSGPSGSGKTTLCRRLAGEKLASYARSCTTRPMRDGEKDGVDYFFLSKEDFAAKVAAGEFLEHAEVHGNFYGTLLSEVVGHLQKGTDVVLDIDVQGAAQVRTCDDAEIKASLVDLFVAPPTTEELLARLSGRGTDSQEVIDLRMKNALEEIAHKVHYRYHLDSGTHDEDYERFRSLLIGSRLRAALQK